MRGHWGEKGIEFIKGGIQEDRAIEEVKTKDQTVTGRGTLIKGGIGMSTRGQQ